MAKEEQNVRIIELGISQVGNNYRDQQLAIAALAQESARARVAASAPTALTDNSAGTPAGGNALAAVVTPSKGSHDGVTLFAPKAGFDTVIGLIEDGHEELRSKVNELIVLTAGNTAATVEAITTAAAADNTIAVIEPGLGEGAVLTAVATNCVDAATGLTQINVARNNQAAIASAINYVRVAMGLAPITDGSGGVFNRTNTAWPTTDAAATAAAITVNGTDNTLTDASVDAALTAMANNIASMAAALNEMRGAIAIGPFVVATSNPRTRFAGADITP